MTHIEKFDVRNRRTNAVEFTADITCAPDASVSVKLGLAVRWGVANKADLSGAYLRYADLRGAYLRGADLRRAYKIDRLLAIAQRLDGYEFRAYRLQDGSVKIVAGRRCFTADEFRTHVAAEYPDTPKAVETLSIIEHIDRMAALFPAAEVTA